MLSDLSEIKLGVSYKHTNGTPMNSFPADLTDLEESKASYTFSFFLLNCRVLE